MKFVLGTLCSFATLCSCSVAGPEPGAAPWYAGARTSYGSASRLEVVAGHYLDPALAIGARVRNRVLLGAVVASAIGDDLDVDLLEVAGHVRLSPITSGSTRPWIDLLAGTSHAGATRGSPSATGFLWGAEAGVSQFVSDRVALELGLGYSHVDLGRGFGAEEDVEVLFGVSVRF